jgi:hypothetical protein
VIRRSIWFLISVNGPVPRPLATASAQEPFLPFLRAPKIVIAVSCKNTKRDNNSQTFRLKPKCQSWRMNIDSILCGKSKLNQNPEAD